MRVRVLAPGLWALGVLAASGCGSGPTATVTVTTSVAPAAPDGPPVAGPATTTVPAPRPSTTTTVARTTTRRAPATTTTTTTTTTTRRRTRSRTTTSPTTTTRPPEDPDPIGGTVPSSGRIAGTGYSVVVPPGWSDGSRRFEGNETDFDLSLVKRPGARLTSNIVTDRSRPAGLGGRRIGELTDDLRQDVEDRLPGSEITRGPDLEVDGEPAVVLVVRRRLARTTVVQRQVALLRGPVLVLVRLTAPERDLRDDRRVFARFLRSWRWSGAD